jgi:hypothetical protein
MRWKQRINDDGTSRFDPIDDAAIKRDGGISIHGVFEPFVSVVDGTEIATAKQLREHNKRNNVVNAGEFSDEHYASKAKERERLYSGEHTSAETFARKQEIYNIIQRAEDNGRRH